MSTKTDPWKPILFKLYLSEQVGKLVDESVDEALTALKAQALAEALEIIGSDAMATHVYESIFRHALIQKFKDHYERGSK